MLNVKRAKGLRLPLTNLTIFLFILVFICICAAVVYLPEARVRPVSPIWWLNGSKVDDADKIEAIFRSRLPLGTRREVFESFIASLQGISACEVAAGECIRIETFLLGCDFAWLVTFEFEGGYLDKVSASSDYGACL